MYRSGLLMKPAPLVHWKRCLAPSSKYISRIRHSTVVEDFAASKSEVSQQQYRTMASMVPLPRKVSKVTDHLIYNQYHPEETEIGKTPIVLFLPWVTVNEKSAQRFEDIYGQRGFNVLTVWNEVKHFVWPKTAFQLSREVLKYLQAEVDCDLVIHGMSIGAYLYTMIVMSALNNPKDTSYLRDHVKGNIFDSIVCGGLHQMALGVSKTVASNVVLETLLRGTILAYFNITKSHTVDIYDKAIQLFIDNPLLSSVLLLYSTADHMSDSEMVERIVQTWKDRGMHVRLQKWTDSKHVELMRNHTTEYLGRLDEYLAYIKPTIKIKNISAKL